MNARRVALILGAVLALLVITIPAASEPEQDITVDGADVILEVPVIPNQSLFDAIAVAGRRVVVQFSNHIRGMALVVDPDLLPYLDQVSERVVAEYANEILREDLAPVPGGLQILLDQMAERVVFPYANANLAYSLYYPRDLVNDAAPPVVSEIDVGQIEANGILTLTWITDEFANSTVLYGTTPGSYPTVVSDPLYVKLHAVPLVGLVDGTTYYARLRSVDMSNNTTTTPEFSFIPTPGHLFVYLPLVVRNPP